MGMWEMEMGKCIPLKGNRTPKDFSAKGERYYHVYFRDQNLRGGGPWRRKTKDSRTTLRSLIHRGVKRSGESRD